MPAYLLISVVHVPFYSYLFFRKIGGFFCLFECCQLLSSFLKFGLTQSWISFPTHVSLHYQYSMMFETSTVFSFQRELHHGLPSIATGTNLFLHTMIPFLATKWSSNEKNMLIHQKRVTKAPQKNMVSIRVTIQFWWLKLYVHCQNRMTDSPKHMFDASNRLYIYIYIKPILDSQNTRFMRSAPQVLLSKKKRLQKPGQLPFAVAKTPRFRTQAMRKAPFSALSNTG